MNLGRTWSRARRREAIDRLSLPTRDDFQPLDTREQLELVSSFERQHALSSRLWRGIFSAILLIFVGFLIYSIFQQVLHPWEWRFHAYFMEDISSWAVTLADLAGILACLMAVMGLQVRSSSLPWLWSSCLIAVLLAIFWLYHIFRLPKFRWDAMWLALGPMSGALACFYVEHLLAESWEEIRKLRAAVYSYKAN
ncbi:histone-lysine N-methyltransferase isoform X1 [Wolffia australiana]